MRSIVRSSAPSIFCATMVLLLLSCHGGSPTEPVGQPGQPGTSRLGFVGGYVYSASGGCVPGAVVEVMDGARAGARSVHIDHCQSPWDYENEIGYQFEDLPPNLSVRLRASREGYRAQEKTFFATTGSYTRSDFVLEKE